MFIEYPTSHRLLLSGDKKMTSKLLIQKTEEFVKKTMKGDPGHDWSHVNRVRKLALYIGKKEKANLLIVELAALLHDIADYKFNKGNEKTNDRPGRKGVSSDMAGVASGTAHRVQFATESIHDSSGLSYARQLKFLYDVNNPG